MPPVGSNACGNLATMLLAALLSGALACATSGADSATAPASAPIPSAPPVTPGPASAGSAADVDVPDFWHESPAPRRGWLGVELAVTPSAQAGVLVRAVVPGSPAEQAGIVAGDVIVRVDGRGVLAPPDVVQAISARAPGERVSVSLKRGRDDRLLAVSLAARPDEGAVHRMRFVGAPAPAFDSLQVAQGAVPPTLGGLRGKVVVVEFWSPWCQVCRLLVPVLNDWHARLSSQGVEIVGITTEGVVPATAAARQFGIEHPVLSDPTARTTRAYRALAVPTVFVIDRKGTVRQVMVGYLEEEIREIETLIERLIAEP